MNTHLTDKMIEYHFVEWTEPELEQMGISSIWHYQCESLTPEERVIPDGNIALCSFYAVGDFPTENHVAKNLGKFFYRTWYQKFTQKSDNSVKP